MKYIYIQSELENSNRLFIWVLWLIKHCRLFNAKSTFIQKIVQFQTIHVSLSTFEVSMFFNSVQKDIC